MKGHVQCPDCLKWIECDEMPPFTDEDWKGLQFVALYVDGEMRKNGGPGAPEVVFALNDLSARIRSIVEKK